MPATTPEAIERRNRRRREKRAAGKVAAHRPIEIKKSDLPSHKITARRMLPRLPWNISKAELREILATAAANTARK